MSRRRGQEEVHATTAQLQWIVDSYAMVFAGLLLVAGSLADRLGRKRVLLAGLAAFAAGSTWAAFSGSVGYQDTMTSALAPYHVPHAVMQAILGSVGGALEVAARAGGVLGAALGHLARTAFASGMDLGLTVGACVAAAGCLVALLTLPPRDDR